MWYNGSVIEEKVFKFYIPKGLIFGFIALVCLTVPHALGLSIARNGLEIDGVHQSSSQIFKMLDFSSGAFLLLGWSTTALLVISVLVAILYSRVKVLKYITLIFVVITQFLTGLSYTRQNFRNPTYVVYHHQSYKVNAIDIGIISVVFTTIVFILLLVLVLILKRRMKVFAKLLTKKVAIISFILLNILSVTVVYFAGILELYGGLPTT
jgi:hypothetical protein